MCGVAPQIPGDRVGHAAARRYEGRGASLIPLGLELASHEERKMGSLWEQRRNFLSGEGGIRPGFHILYKTVTRQWPHLLFSRSVLFDSLGPHRLQHARLSCPSPTLGAKLKLMSIVSGDANQQFHPLSFPFPPTFNLSQLQGLFL